MKSNGLNKVAVTKYNGSLDAVKNGIERVGGLQGLKPSDSILIKPNIVWGAGGSKAKEDSAKVILFGDCAIRNNKSIAAAIKVKGCPPKIVDSMVAMINHSLDKKRARKVLTTRMVKGVLNKIGLYHEFFPRPYAYDPPEFDPAHF